MTDYIVNGKPADKFTRQQERSISLTRQRRTALTGTIMSEGEATQNYVRKLRWLFGFLAVVSVLVVVVVSTADGGAMLADVADRWLLYPVELFILVGLGLFLFWRYRVLIQEWDDKIADRMAVLSPPGSVVQVDDNGLTLGAALYPWPSLKIDTMELSKMSSRGRVLFLIDRMLLSTADQKPALDAGVTFNGRRLIDNAYRRLRKSTR